MILPLQVRFLHMEPFQPAERWVREAMEKLDQYYPKIMSCRVVIEVPHREREWGNPFQVRIDLSVPGKELVVMHDPDLHSTVQRMGRRRKTKRLEIKDQYKDLHAAIRDAFESMQRQLREYAKLRRREVKKHEAPPRARVSRLFPEDQYGFLTTPDGRDFYFHRNSVLRNRFDQLRIGSEVTFTPEEGEKGPQASTVRVVHASRKPQRRGKRRRARSSS